MTLYKPTFRRNTLPPSFSRESSYFENIGYAPSKLHVNITHKFLFNNQPDALIIQIYSVIKLYMFRASSLPIIRSFILYIRHWQVSRSFDDRRVRMERSSILTLLGSRIISVSGWLLKRSLLRCMIP